jgi:hypothetical protein
MNNIKIERLENLPSPKCIFEMVMDFAKSTNRSQWLCFGQVFSDEYMTVVIMENDNYIGYYTGRIVYDPECSLFIHQSYFKYPIKNAREVSDIVAIDMANKTGSFPKQITHHSSLPTRLWERRYGFTLSKERIYIKKFPKEV